MSTAQRVEGEDPGYVGDVRQRTDRAVGHDLKISTVIARYAFLAVCQRATRHARDAVTSEAFAKEKADNLKLGMRSVN